MQPNESSWLTWMQKETIVVDRNFFDLKKKKRLTAFM
jgi:hypothetical protein